MASASPTLAPLPPAPQGAPLPFLAGLATAAPARTLDQRAVLELLGLAGDDFAEAIFARCGVRRRHLDLTPELVAQTLQARSPQSERRTQELAEQAIARLAFDPAEIGVVVSASLCTLGTPSLAHRLVDRLGLPSDVDKYHLVGVGCASAVPLLRLAAQALRERPGQRALVVAAEWMSGILTPVAPGDAKVKTVGSSLFGDGAAAALLALDARPGADSGDAPGALPRIAASAVHQLPGTLADVRSEMTSLDSQVQMSKALPRYARSELSGLIDAFLARHGLTRDEVDHWPVHPGGRGILDGIKAGVGLGDDDVAASAAVLAEHGNVGTPSAFFVLDELVRRRAPRPGERGLMVTIGPGVTVGLALLRW
jgi:predicted naringenin-chalcone synthase